MGVTSSMWTAVSGLLVHGEKMNVVGNNIANVNTMAFKSQRMDFEDFVYQDTNSANGFAQIGRGANINAIMGDFSQGAQERSNTVTDISINGKGFFKVRNPNSEDDVYYTRAGNFRFNKNGELTDSLKTVMKSLFTNPSVVSMGEFIHKLIIDCKQSSEDADLIQKIINESPAEMVEETTDAAS